MRKDKTMKVYGGDTSSRVVLSHNAQIREKEYRSVARDKKFVRTPIIPLRRNPYSSMANDRMKAPSTRHSTDIDWDRKFILVTHTRTRNREQRIAFHNTVGGDLSLIASTTLFHEPLIR
jgi:hypothetical protein